MLFIRLIGYTTAAYFNLIGLGWSWQRFENRPQCKSLEDRHIRQEEVFTYEQLSTKLKRISSGSSILLRDGVYKIPSPILIKVPNITLRSLSGDRDKVILDGFGNQGKPNRKRFVNEIIHVKASNITIADLTIMHARHHGIHAVGSDTGTIQNLLMHNIVVKDCGQHQIKVNSNGGNPLYWVDKGVVQCSKIEITDFRVVQDNGDRCYCGGIDVHGGNGWIIRDNFFQNLTCKNKLMDHAVFFWSRSRNTKVIRNYFKNVYRAIGIGMKSKPKGHVRSYPDSAGENPYYDHIGGEIFGNVVYNQSGIHLETGLELSNVLNAEVYHNTIYSEDKPFNSIEYRWPNTKVVIMNNLLSHNVLRRNGAKAKLKANLQNAPKAYFKNIAAGDLRLTKNAFKCIDKAIFLERPDFKKDIDGILRTKPDIGAYEYR